MDDDGGRWNINFVAVRTTDESALLPIDSQLSQASINYLTIKSMRKVISEWKGSWVRKNIESKIGVKVEVEPLPGRGELEKFANSECHLSILNDSYCGDINTSRSWMKRNRKKSKGGENDETTIQVNWPRCFLVSFYFRKLSAILNNLQICHHFFIITKTWVVVDLVEFQVRV